MAKPSALGPGTEAGKQILSDFKNWKNTGFKPWGHGVGGSNHYQSRKMYQVVTLAAFCAQAKKIARIALEQMPACDMELPTKNASKEEGRDDDGEKKVPLDSEKNNPWLKSENQLQFEETPNVESDSDAEFSMVSTEESIDSLDGFDEIEPGELQNCMLAFLSEYPCGQKLLAIFPLDGNTKDLDSNYFEFAEDYTIVRRWSKVPKERENAIDLIGIGTEQQRPGFGFNEVDLMVLDAEIRKQLKANEHKRNENGNIWEIQESLSLPFKCHPKLFSKTGKELSNFCRRENSHGFAWGYFWMLAWTPPKRKQNKRMGGQKVSAMSKEDSSIYTERTIKSFRKKL